MCIGKINVAISAPFVMTPQKIGTTFSNVHTRAKERGEPKSYQMWRINAIPYGRPICYRRGSCAVHQKDGSIMTLMSTHSITQSTHRQFTTAWFDETNQMAGSNCSWGGLVTNGAIYKRTFLRKRLVRKHQSRQIPRNKWALGGKLP